ncbi:MAG: hypothetical protein A3G33_02930 [Omnitrophica bacterium RIFCSPLOWO2_12_FULL_44_17]|uniref:Aminotransferase DegT n=1 Tax=Candidatus Danuiimicrobium aquiferis TaxID=1801832 RepID=A0A1G1KVH5_9BACT|nr:MAG: hypothetical protein A3B72_04410 [Omnitrophica bacterium RIFCSPHIGHO2_02_FULL_45_28]OGW90425.1 MAG: hypothetical protein A3E74_04225 [Omnitrophica bacterium RIFCSPHIGHO2_12_FULL_44_12]OGW96933.1 MAG: hypothetical protein A3G33_02930 [Omnitrophica bacterium RIFCSPLOWO2_12_FULL_44_17]OGX03931.1 MAG: hypothetical protein A3J12_03485 [Omnitrophica bacterium RIFCSPLOWO2_02_FULL_44_11]
MIQVFSNTLGEEEIQAARNVINSRWLGMGQECKAFEKELGNYFGTERVLLTNCCTSAIFIAIRALGIGKGDEVIVTTCNFNAIPSAILSVGAKPVFADVDPKTCNILPSEIDRLKTRKTKAVFILHYGGHPAPFDEIKVACGKKIKIIEDSANSVSSKYKGTHCGNLGAAGVFSFDAMKILVMGDGGALIINDEAAFNLAKSLRYLGFPSTTTSGTDSLKQGNLRWWEFELSNVSGRFISNDILASMGRVQLRKLPQFIERRKQVWDYYQKNLSNIPGAITPPEPLPGCTSTYYLYWLKVPKKRDQLANYLKDKGIYTTFRYYPLHLVKYLKSKAHLKNAEEINETMLNIPLHQNLSDADAEKTVSEIRQFFK